MQWIEPHSRLIILGNENEELRRFELNPLETEIVTHQIAATRGDLDSDELHSASDAHVNMARFVTQTGLASVEGLSCLSKIPTAQLQEILDGKRVLLSLEQYERLILILLLLDNTEL